jgi:uncharacterized CHY-type Zn-finger protein
MAYIHASFDLPRPPLFPSASHSRKSQHVVRVFAAASSISRAHSARASKHILNAQVSIRAPCCRQWYDCAECHAAAQTHPLARAHEMAFACKRCKKAFRKDLRAYDESDEYCPHCDNHYVLEAKTPQALIGVEADDIRMDARCVHARLEPCSYSSPPADAGCSRTSASSRTRPGCSVAGTRATSWADLPISTYPSFSLMSSHPGMHNE